MTGALIPDRLTGYSLILFGRSGIALPDYYRLLSFFRPVTKNPE
jgi:hypothetical protein